MSIHSYRLRAFGATDIGRKRPANEDAFLVSEDQGLFLVSDGMGGARAGALASAAVVQSLPLQIVAQRMARSLGGPFNPTGVADGLVRAIGFVNEMLLEKTRGIAEVKGLGATVVALLAVGEGTVALAHLGDSRAYLLRHGFFERLTDDHTVANMLFRSGHIARRQMHRHPMRHALTRHIGMEECPAADAVLLHLQPGDRMLLCSDGLTGMLTDREIGGILLETGDREAVCHLLIARANEASGRDNITAVIVDAVPEVSREMRRRKKVVVRRAIGRSCSMPREEGKSEEGIFLAL